MLSTRARALLCLSISLLAAVAVLPALAGAAVITVNTTADQAPVAGQCSGVLGDCSLRQALGLANDSAGPDTVVVPAGQYALTIKGAEEDNGASGDLDVIGASNITVQGAGARTTVIDATGLGDRVLDVLPTGTLSLSRLTVSGGEVVDANGGGIRVDEGVLNLDRVAVLSNNSLKSGFGGGIDLERKSTATIADSLLAANRNSGNGGGIHADESTLAVVNTTIANNLVDTALYLEEPAWGAFGGGVEVEHGKLVLQNVDIVNNSIRDANGGSQGGGAGLAASADSTEIVNTIVSGNNAIAVENASQCREPVPSLGHNLEEPPAPGTPRCFEGPADLIANPLLGPLTDNGGETDTMALPLGSPAIDSGDLARCPASDQRGIVRPQLHGCDIGAYEYVPPPPTIKRHGKVKVKRSGKTFLVKPGYVVSCPAGLEQCGGKINVRWKKGVIGKKKFTVTSGKSKTLSLKLTKRGAKLLRERGRLKGRFEVAARSGVSEQVRATATLKLRLPKRHGAHEH